MPYFSDQYLSNDSRNPNTETKGLPKVFTAVAVANKLQSIQNSCAWYIYLSSYIIKMTL